MMAKENNRRGQMALLWAVLVWLLGPGMVTAEPLAIQTQSGQIELDVEMAVDARDRGRGLMHRESLPERGGMLFDFGKEVPVSMWMRNTLIPLDMIFADKTGVIRHIHRGAKPHDETIIEAPDPMQWVLEVNAGFVDRFKIQTGDAFVFTPD